MRSVLSLFLFAVVAALALATSVHAQDPITFTTSASSFYTMSYVDSVPAKQSFTNSGAPFTQGSSGVRDRQAIGFSFKFFNTAYTQLGIGYNGNLQWGASSISGVVPAAIPTSAVSVPILGWFSADLNCLPNLCGGGYGVVGTAPNRQFIVRALNWTYQTTSANAGVGDLDIDIVLFETSNRVEIRYYSVSPLPSSSYPVTIGAQQSTSNWLAVLSNNATVDTTSYLQGRTIVLLPATSVSSSAAPAVPSDASSAESAVPSPDASSAEPVVPSDASSSVVAGVAASSSALPPLPLNPTNGANPWYIVAAADTIPPKVQFNYSGAAFTSGSNGVRESIAIGFTFEYFGVPYTRLGVGYNGNLQWGSSEVSGILPNGIPSATQTFPIFAWFAADLNCVQGVCGGGYGLIGEAPNRQFIIRANNWTYQRSSSTGTGDIDIDIVLTESENTIVVRYYSVSALPSSAYKVTVGVQNAQNDDWTSVLSLQTGFDVTQTLQGRTIIFAPNSE